MVGGLDQCLGMMRKQVRERVEEESVKWSLFCRREVQKCFGQIKMKKGEVSNKKKIDQLK